MAPDAVTDRMLALERRCRAAYETYMAKVEGARSELERTAREIDAELQSLTREAGSLEVLVRRTPGPDVKLFHSANFPCGRVTGRSRSLTSFEKMSERAARLRGLDRCTACDWRRHEQAESRTG